MSTKTCFILCPLLAAVASAADTVGATIDENGVTQIFGNSFGRAGRNETYDYVVVGGGNAGNTIAARLARDPANYTVAVVEAGSFYEILNGNLTQIPGYAFMSAEPNYASGGLSSLTAIGLETVPQVGYNGRTVLYTVGQTFGGGSAANTGGYHRQTPGTYDTWAELVGDDYWRWENAWDFFQRSCNFIPPDYSRIDPSLNITYDPNAFIDEAGPLQVSYGNFQGPYGPYLAEAYERMGFDALPGLNSGRLMGYGTMTAAIDPVTATRSSSETSFLQWGARSPGLKIYPNALAKRILFDEERRATGVLVQGNVYNNELVYEISARNEVILSAGVWFTPQLLMVSGVGPAETLTEHGIDVVADLPGVGQNEEDSPYMSLVFGVNVTTNTQLAAGNPVAVEEAVSQYLASQSGRLSSIGTGQGFAFEKYPEHLRQDFSEATLDHLSNFPEDVPEVEYVPLESSSFPDDLGPEDYYFTIGSALLATRSRGNITIQSADSAVPPIINPNWLLDPADQEMAVAAFRRVREVASNSSMIQLEYSPGPEVASDEDILEWLRDNMNLIYHGTSTARMGRDDDETAVVDSRARVRGVTGLRVVDASAMPNLPPGHTMGAVYMFAEAIANSILEGN
ncbi:hypothetical protein DL769_007038 [Monosporascus sp. CRB-8-3]|nr:hypothetical protein DL769_007038 [Monosporascus sp. CRB-8-3]